MTKAGAGRKSCSANQDEAREAAIGSLGQSAPARLAGPHESDHRGVKRGGRAGAPDDASWRGPTQMSGSVVLDVAEGSRIIAVGRVQFVRGKTRYRTYRPISLSSKSSFVLQHCGPIG